MNSSIFPIGKTVLLFVFCLLLLQACDSSDTTTLAKDKLAGNWLFEKGTIDGSKTDVKLLNNLTFHFTETEFSCNLLSEMVAGFSNTEPYIIEEQTIVVNKELRISVKDLTTGTLEVSFDIKINDAPRNYTLLFSKVVG